MLEPFRELLSQVAPDATLLSVEPLVGGISATMNVVTFLDRQGSLARCVAREPGHWQDAESVAQEFAVIAALATGGLPVPRPFGLATTASGRPVMFLEYVEGRPELAPTDPESFVDQFADQLAEIHGFDYRQLPYEERATTDSPVPKAWQGPNHAQREPEVRAALDGWDHERDRNAPVLRHGDFWPGNLLWRDGRIAAVIDWEEWQVAEPLYDLAICRLDLAWILGWEAAERFTHRYLSRRPISTAALAAYDLCAALRPMGNMDEWAQAYPALGRPDLTLPKLEQVHQAFVDQALRALSR